MRQKRATTLETFAEEIETRSPDPKRETDPKRPVEDTGGLVGVDDKLATAPRTGGETTGTDAVTFRGKGFGMRATAAKSSPGVIIIGLYTDHTFTTPVDGGRSFAIGSAADMVAPWLEREGRA